MIEKFPKHMLFVQEGNNSDISVPIFSNLTTILVSGKIKNCRFIKIILKESGL